MGERRAANRLWYLLVNVLGASPFLLGHTRARFLARAGIDLRSTQLRAGCWFATDRVFFAGDGLIERGTHFENREPIRIGRGVYIGPDAYIATSSHEIGSSDQRAGGYRGAPVTIEDGCWLGARVTVLPGVTIARGCVIAAASVVTRNTEPDGLYAGAPAVRKRDLALD